MKLKGVNLLMKKMLSFCAAFLLAANTFGLVKAGEVQRNSDGTINYSVNDVILVKSGDEEIIQLAGGPLKIVSEQPSDEEIAGNIVLKYWVDCENPYLIYFDTDKGKIVKEDFELNISYIWDYNLNKIYDYETMEILGKLRKLYKDPIMPPDTKAVTISESGRPRFDARAVVLFRTKSGETLKFMDLGAISVRTEEPSEEVIKQHPDVYYWIDCDKPYIMYYDNEIVRQDYELKVDGIFDLDKAVLYHYETGEELASMKEYIIKAYGDNTVDRLICFKGYSEEYSGYIAESPTIGAGADSESYSIPGDFNNDSIVDGDLDFSGTVDLTDLSELALALIGDKTLDEIQHAAADINGDGEVNVSDLARLKQYVSNMISSLR